MTTKKRQTQKERILNYMNDNGRISELEALKYCGCKRLSARIYDLKLDGHKINCVRKQVKNKDGSISYVTNYYTFIPVLKDQEAYGK